ncbi:MAG: hypothetical protein E5W75_22665, partial [Mesorhizobium sp.]
MSDVIEGLLVTGGRAIGDAQADTATQRTLPCQVPTRLFCNSAQSLWPSQMGRLVVAAKTPACDIADMAPTPSIPKAA